MSIDVEPVIIAGKPAGSMTGASGDWVRVTCALGLTTGGGGANFGASSIKSAGIIGLDGAEGGGNGGGVFSS